MGGGDFEFGFEVVPLENGSIDVTKPRRAASPQVPILPPSTATVTTPLNFQFSRLPTLVGAPIFAPPPPPRIVVVEEPPEPEPVIISNFLLEKKV